ncbi:hypothetical protein OSB04_000324 [Centaurea solstitialis]|uniref:Actin cross-linking n=1 Tax=Centaurea solstitialis TaxID=347529 RepID=A0AA38TNV1_9ASTR|nr:hypothetical protein OSB04_000324 [Centaurea solstitialis]
MEFFNKPKIIKLRSHLGKFLVAGDDELTVRQSRNSSSIKSRWTVELVGGKSHVIRLKSCFSGKYLAPSGEPFLLGMTGKKVVQDFPANKRDSSIEWEPIKEGGGGSVRLRAKGGRFLRANGGTPPWRNSVTCDVPHRTATQDWVLWEVEAVEMGGLESQESVVSELSPASSFSSVPGIGMSSITDGSPRVSGRLISFHFIPSKKLDNGVLTRTVKIQKLQRKSGMELFHRAKAVRLQGYHNKYLVADDDEETVRQSRNGGSSKARWTIEYIKENPNAIRLKSCHGLYLSATNEAFLLGMTGKKVQQYPHQIKPDHTTVWEPIREGPFHVKLQSSDGKFLRANGGTPPWRNSVTHDVPHRTATQDWVLWGVDVVDISLSDTESVMSSLSSFSSVGDDYCGSPGTGSPSPQNVVTRSFKDRESKLSGGMEFFRKAKSVRLKSHHDKYLLAESNGENVLQDRQGTTKSVIWTVEFVDGFDNIVRLKSVHNKYLTASADQKILGVTGRKVVQTMPSKLDSSVEWEPIRDGFQVRLKTRYGNYLRANGGLPPWRNSITHDIPYKHHNWILWDVEIVEARLEEPPRSSPSPSPRADDDEVVVVPSETMNPELDSSSFRLMTPRSNRIETNAKMEGRMIYYTTVDDDGHVGGEERWFAFKGNGLEDLTRKLEELIGIDDIIVCSRNPLNGKLFPMRLALPPNNTTMHIVVVPPTSKAISHLINQHLAYQLSTSLPNTVF